MLHFGNDFAYCELELLLQITPLDKKNGGFDDTELQVLDESSAKSTKNVETNTEMPKSKNFKLQVGQNLKLTILKGGDRKKSHQVVCIIVQKLFFGGKNPQKVSFMACGITSLIFYNGNLPNESLTTRQHPLIFV